MEFIEECIILMNKNDNIGGRAYSNGVRLNNKRKSVKAYYDIEGSLKVKVNNVKNNEYLKYIKMIPILRGIATILIAIFSFLKEASKKPKKYWFIFLIIILDIIYISLPDSSGVMLEEIILFFYIAVPIILIYIFRNNISEVLKYHGAEHKAVNYYEDEYNNNISSYSRIHRRCGSNVVFYYIIISVVAGFFDLGLNIYLKEILILGLAFEVLKYTPDKFLFIPTVFQKLVTREPDERHIKAAKMALKILTLKNLSKDNI